MRQFGLKAARDASGVTKSSISGCDAFFVTRKPKIVELVMVISGILISVDKQILIGKQR